MAEVHGNRTHTPKSKRLNSLKNQGAFGFRGKSGGRGGEARAEGEPGLPGRGGEGFDGYADDPYTPTYP